MLLAIRMSAPRPSSASPVRAGSSKDPGSAPPPREAPELAPLFGALLVGLGYAGAAGWLGPPYPLGLSLGWATLGAVVAGLLEGGAWQTPWRKRWLAMVPALISSLALVTSATVQLAGRRALHPSELAIPLIAALMLYWVLRKLLLRAGRSFSARSAALLAAAACLLGPGLAFGVGAFWLQPALVDHPPDTIEHELVLRFEPPRHFRFNQEALSPPALAALVASLSEEFAHLVVIVEAASQRSQARRALLPVTEPLGIPIRFRPPSGP